MITNQAIGALSCPYVADTKEANEWTPWKYGSEGEFLSSVDENLTIT